jgi:hypothetical protein
MNNLTLASFAIILERSAIVLSSPEKGRIPTGDAIMIVSMVIEHDFVGPRIDGLVSCQQNLQS